MRSQKIMLLLGMAVLIGAGLILFGCPSDETPTNNNGDLNDPEFLQVYGQLNDFIDSTLYNFNAGLGSMYTLSADTLVDPVQYGPIDPNAHTDSSSVTYSQQGWHVVYVAYHTDDYNTIITDSIQFLKDGEFQQTAVDLESILYRHRWQYDVPDPEVRHTTFDGRSDFTFGDLDTDLGSVNGSNSLEAVSKFISNDSTVERKFNFDADLSNIRISKTGSGWAQGCPKSGSVAFSLQMVYQKDEEAPDTTNWNGTINFTYGTGTYNFGNGSSSWAYSQNECSAPTN